MGAVAVLLAGLSAAAAQAPAPELRVAEARKSRTVTVPNEADRLRRVQLKLGQSLIEHLQKGKSAPNNTVVSPASLAMIMAVLDLGADDALRDALHRALGFERRNTKDLKAATADLAALRNAAKAVQGDPAIADVLKVANAIFFEKGSPLTEGALDKVRAAGAEVFVDSISTPAALQKINGWVAEKTNGLIPTILDQPPSNAGLVGLNAVYFKDQWRTPFDAAATRPAPFQRADGSSVVVPMMRASMRQRLRIDETFAGVELPYSHDRFSLVLLTRRDKPAAPADFAQAQAWLSGEGFTEDQVELAMPRFTLTEGESLLEALDSMGLDRGRSSPTAFKGFSPSPQAIGAVVQKVFVRVDEAGTEAAAATAVVTTRSLHTAGHRITFDKPFLFALRDRTTGLVLLSGYVGNPPAAPEAAAQKAPQEVPRQDAAPQPEAEAEPTQPSVDQGDAQEQR